MPLKILIFEKTPLISQDLYETVTSTAPDAEVRVFPNLSEAVKELGPSFDADIAFLGSLHDVMGDQAILTSLTSRVRRVVITDDLAAPDAPDLMARQRNWFVLPRPFVPNAIMAHVVAALTEAITPANDKQFSGACADPR